MRDAVKHLRFPLLGVARNLSYRESTLPPEQQREYSAPFALNVRGTCTFADRRRGGSRPGLMRVNAGVVSDSTGKWAWPSGGTILWPTGDAIALNLFSSIIYAPDGTAVIDPHATFSYAASKGDAPIGASVMCLYRARLFLAKESAWYCSRTGDVTDFDYGGDKEDMARPAAGSVALAGVKGEDITAFMPVGDTCLYIATRRSLWRLDGEPTQGNITRVSDFAGCCCNTAWCADGPRVFFISNRGLWTVMPGEMPMAFSSNIPDEFKGMEHALLATDPAGEGFHVFAERRDETVSDWYVDVASRAFWPQAFKSEHRPSAVCRMFVLGEEKTAMLCADGKWRAFSDGSDTDDGEDLASVVAVGPFHVSAREDLDGMLAEIHATFGVGSAEMNIGVAMGHSAEDAVRAAEDGDILTYSFTEGWNHTLRPRTRGAWCVLKLSSVGRWAYESILVNLKHLGRLR